MSGTVWPQVVLSNAFGVPYDSGTPVPVTGTVTATSAATATAAAPSYIEGTSNPLSQNLSGDMRVIAKQSGSYAVTGTFWQTTQPVSIASMPSTPVTGTFWQATQPVSGTVTTTPPANASTNVAQINGVTALMGNGITGTGSQRVTIASDNTAFSVNAVQSGTWNIGTVTTLPALPANQSVNNAQVNGVTPLMGNGITGTGSQRVTIASDNTAFAVNATVTQATGTNLHAVVDSGTITTVSTVTAVTAITNALPAGTNIIGHVIDDASATAGGISTTARLASAAGSTNATLVKGSAGRIYCIEGKNNAAYDVFLVLYDSAANPPVPGSTTIRKKVVCPAGQAFIRDYPLGLSFATGIGYAFTKLVADADTTVLVAADITAFNMDYV